MANIDFNINEVIADFISDKLDEIFDVGKDLMKKANNQVDLKLKNKYKAYLKAIANRYGKTRSFFLREPHFLYDFYIPIGVQSGKVKIKTTALSEIVSNNRFAIITGSGGTGKSILLKHLLLESLKEKYKVPILVELRDLNENPGKLKDVVEETLSDFGLSLNQDYFEKSLLAGHYILFLDGFDEVKPDLRKDLIKDINTFTKRYKDCDVLISTRPDESIFGLDLFESWKTLPLDLEKSVALVEKLPADEEIKKKFIKDLKSGLFAKHESFLCNPLLLSIMLLTYGFSADIPTKITIFYSQAFEALFQRHDAYKGAYKRIKETNLDIGDFEKLFRAFCILTYDTRTLRFDRIQALEFIKKAKDLTGINCNAEAFLSDLLQVVCLLLQDGLQITFSHRSFQEYFSAKYIVAANNELKLMLIKRYVNAFTSDSLYRLIYELDKEFMDYEVILPFINSYLDKLEFKGRVTKKMFTEYLKDVYSEIRIYEIESKNNIQLSAVIKDLELSHVLDMAYNYVDHDFKKFFNPVRLKDIESNIYKTKDLSTNHKLINYLYDSSGFCSKTYIEGINKIRNILIKRAEERKKDINDIFSIKI